MSVRFPPIPSLRMKEFFFDVKDRRGVDRGISGHYTSDTTSASYTVSAGSRITARTYTFTSSAKTNGIRVRAYGYCSTSSFVAILNINNVDVISVTVTPSTSAVLMYDYIGSIPSSTSITIKIDLQNTGSAGITVNITKVVIIAGFMVNTTSDVDILTVNLDQYDSYMLRVNGNFGYKIGVRYWFIGNRKTTATATFYSTLQNEIQSGTYNASAKDDGDTNDIFFIRTGDYSTSFTIRGRVNASGDVIIITSIRAQVILRACNRDKYNHRDIWEVIIREKGLAHIVSRHVTIVGTYAFQYAVVTQDRVSTVYATSTGSDITMSYIIQCGDECTCHIDCGDDSYGYGFFLYLSIIILGE